MDEIGETEIQNEKNHYYVVIAVIGIWLFYKYFFKEFCNNTNERVYRTETPHQTINRMERHMRTLRRQNRELTITYQRIISLLVLAYILGFVTREIFTILYDVTPINGCRAQ